MIIGSNAKLRKATEINIYVKIILIQNVTSHKLLWIIVDSSLAWTLQVDSVCKKANSKIALLKRIYYFLNEHMRTLLYNAYIFPVLDYCCRIWGRYMKKIAILQKRSAKIILFKPSLTPSRELFKKLEWLTFENRCKY